MRLAVEKIVEESKRAAQYPVVYVEGNLPVANLDHDLLWSISLLQSTS
jgi:hypothetical protein